MPVIQTAERNRRELLAREGAAVGRLADAYRILSTSLQDKIRTLELEVSAMGSAGTLSVDKVQRLTVYGSLLEQVGEELTRFGIIADNELRVSSRYAIDTGLQHSQRLVQSYFDFNPNLTKAFAVSWDNLPVEAIEKMLGFLGTGSPLHSSLLNALSANGVSVFENTLLEGIGLGYNPNKVARLAQQALGQPLTWAINTVRTAQMYAYREATRSNYIANSDIVEGWVWYTQLNGVACLSCVNNHGRRFDLGVPLNDHHLGRCVALPYLPDKFGITQPTYEDGETYFNSLPESQRIQRMGRAKYMAYQAGEFRFSELSEVYANDVYGDMQKEASLVGILGTRARQYYANP